MKKTILAFIALAAILAIFNGMVLDAIRMKEQREFEFRLSLLGMLKKQK